MNILNYFFKKIRFLNDSILKKNLKPTSINELTHPRFEIGKMDNSATKKAQNSLLFLMYSEENEALFI